MMLIARGPMFGKFDDVHTPLSLARLMPEINLRWLLPLLALDGLLILLHAVTGLLMPRIPPLLNIARDFSLGEIFGYFKWAAIVMVLLICYARTRLPVLLAAGAVFALMLADDSLQLHERLGGLGVEQLSLSPTSWGRAQDLGEILVWGLMAAAMLPLLIWGAVATPGWSRWIGIRLMALVVLYAFFGGVVDMMHGSFAALPFGIQIADLIEDGGEMIVASLILAHAVTLLPALRDRAGPHRSL